MRSLCLFLAILACCGTPQQANAQADAWQGQRLEDYLEYLNSHGARIIYSSDLIGDDLTLDSEPASADPLDGLADVLAPFGLQAVAGPAGSLLVTRLPAGPVVDAQASGENASETPIPEIVVTSSLHRLESATPTTNTYVDRELATRIPQTADEVVRLTQRLPGTASGGLSSQSHIRGGEVNEVLFLFDGLRLYEPYHLKDFQAIASIVNSNAIGGMDFYSGAFPARYGDRMSGVLSMDLREPVEARETELALSFFNSSLLSLGTFGGDDQGDWLVSARRSNLEMIVDVVDPDFGSPDYQDYLGHVGWTFGPSARLSANVLVSNDELTLFDAARGEAAVAAYANEVFWLKWQADWSPSLSSDTIVAYSDITDRRNGDLLLPGIVSGSLSDNAEFRALEFRQDWRWIAAEDWMLRFGMNAKELDAEYRFSSIKTVEPPFTTILDNQPEKTTDIELSPDGAQYAAYAELRWRPRPRLTMDFGVRWDQQNYTTADDDEQVSPRASILYRPWERTEIRVGWGQYHQAQEINELQISDGVADFFPAQRAEHFVLNVQHLFPAGIELGVSLYRKSFRTIRPRFENVFNPLTLLPELQFDRVRVDAYRADAKGAEVSVTRGIRDDDLLWWLSYAWSDVEDETTTGDFRRAWDQTHTFKAGLSWRWRHWDFSVAGELHTGWPRTQLYSDFATGDVGQPELLLDVSRHNAGRYSTFHTLDARISRTFDVTYGELTTFLEVTNLSNRANPCCTEYSLAADGSVLARPAHWLPLVPSLGIVWHF